MIPTSGIPTTVGTLPAACFRGQCDSETTTINSNYDAIGVTSQNWQSKFTSGSTSGSVMYAQTVEKDTTIKGTVAVNFSALTENTDDNGTPIGERDALMVSAMLVEYRARRQDLLRFQYLRQLCSQDHAGRGRRLDGRRSPQL